VIVALPAALRRLAAAALALCCIGRAAALEPAGSIPEMYFSDGAPAVVVETVNDSTGACVDRVETDDRRSFGLRAYVAWRDLALAAACDGFTFRGLGADPGSRSDEMSITAAWMGAARGDGFFGVRAGAGAGLRAWGDFGFEAIQRLWHDVLGVNRLFPTAFNPSTLRLFAYASADAAIGLGGPIRGEASIRELVLGSGAVESSIALLAAARSGASENWAGLSWQGRLGSFDASDSLANEYEAGIWLVTGARTGLLYVESAVNFETNFALGSIALRFGGRRTEGGAAMPRQELAVGTSFLESELSTTRFVALPLRGLELRAGIESVEGVSRWLWNETGWPHYQEAGAVVELSAPAAGRALALRPFAGMALGAREDSLSDSGLQRAELVYRSAGFMCKAYVGLRICEVPVPGGSGERIALDLGAGAQAVARPYPPPELLLFLRISVSD
jgi:hypothetical protein